jgi:hypothetical protein
MADIKGYDGAVYIGATPTAVGQTKSWTLSLSKAIADVTTFDANGWTESASTLKSWSGSVSVLFDPTDAGQALLISSFGSGDTVALELVLNDGQGTVEWTYSGSAIVTSQPITSDVTALVEVAFDFTGTGALTTTQGI